MPPPPSFLSTKNILGGFTLSLRRGVDPGNFSKSENGRRVPSLRGFIFSKGLPCL